MLARVRDLTLRLLGADPREYTVCLTGNASAAIRIVAESFPFGHGSCLLLTADNHNSVNGIRAIAERRGGTVKYMQLHPGLRSEDPRPFLVEPVAPSLFAFPAQSNFSGVQHPLEWIREAQAAGFRVLLDAAAYLHTHSLSLTNSPADFVVLSYYKLFGYPTGVGALVARRRSLAILQRDYFAGGTVEFVSVQNRLVRPKVNEEAFEDGTPNFLAMPAVCDGIEWLTNLGLYDVQRHVASLTLLFLEGLESLGRRAMIYGPRSNIDRGGTVAFNMIRNNTVVPFEILEAAARKKGIALRGGCFCNPGAAEAAFAIPAVRAKACVHGVKFKAAEFRKCLNGVVGCLRASFGVANNRDDVDRLLLFLRNGEA